MVNNTTGSKVALCIESFSRTPVSIIRDAVGLQLRQVEPAASPQSTGTSERQLDVQLH
jgi:hypothetical protein